MADVFMFCMVGQHAGPFAGTDKSLCVSPKGWRLVKARKVGDKWHYDPNSPAGIYVCPDHRVEGEPDGEQRIVQERP